MSAPFQPEQDVAAALVAMGAVFGNAGALFNFTAQTNLFAGEPLSPYEPGLGAVNPGVWISPSRKPAPKSAPYLNASQAGSRWWAALCFWVITTNDGTNDGRQLGYLVARQIRDRFHTKVYRNGPLLPTYTSGLSLDDGEPSPPKRTDARQFRFCTDLLLQWNNVN